MSTIYNKGFRSVYKLTAHVVLVTKYRKKAISGEVLIRLKEILSETLLKWECNLVEFNGESDHVHLVIDYKPDFWTGAYFVASCGGVTVSQLKKYVENQKSPQK